jgi:hypothetical protein
MTRDERIKCAFGRHTISSHDREDLLKHQPEERITKCSKCGDIIRLVRDRNFVNRYSMLEIAGVTIPTA